jgi:hypothetical protein
LSDVAIAPDGRLVAVTSCPDEVIAIDIHQQKETARAAGFNNLYAITFALDGSMIAAGGAIGLMGFRLVNPRTDDRSQ